KTPTCTPKDPTNPCDVIHVVANHGGSNGINPPGGQRPPIKRPLALNIGLRLYALRVRTPLDSSCNALGPPNLEQKIGYFDASPVGSGGDAIPCGGTPGSGGFTPIIEGVEDLQVAWLYARDPTNTSSGSTYYYNTCNSTDYKSCAGDST